MKRILLFMAALFVAVSFSSCDKDKDKDALIVGTWQKVRTFGWEIDQEYDSDDTDDRIFWRFNADNTGIIYNYWSEGDGNMPFTYSVDGDVVRDVVIMMSEFEGDKKTVNYKIVKLTSKELYLYIYKRENEYYTKCFIRK